MFVFQQQKPAIAKKEPIVRRCLEWGLLHADDGYSRHVNLYGFRLFAVWFQFIRPDDTVDMYGSRGKEFDGRGRYRGESGKSLFL